MVEFMQNYWYFVAAGLIFLAVLIYWVIEIALAKKEKERQLQLLEKEIEQKEAEKASKKQIKEQQPKQEIELEEKTETQPEVQPQEKLEVESQEKQEQPNETKQQPKELGTYTVSYDKETKEWVVKRRGSERASKRTKTKKEALEVVERLSGNNEVGFVVKKRNGKYQKK